MAVFENNVQRLIALVKSSITGEKLPSDIDFESRFEKIMRLASLHEVAHLVATALLDGGFLKDGENIKYAQKQIYDASYRDTKNAYTKELAEKIFSDNKIPYMPLKGAIIKEYYPERWMRSSCDIDILVQKSDFDRAVNLLKNEGFELDGNLNFHDVSLIYDDTNLELHFSICENIKNIDSMLKNVWDYAEKTGEYEYRQQNNFFVFHHLAHMSYHFLAGGCGIRTFLDLWILKRANFFDYNEVKKLCESAKIGEFCNAAFELTDVWFGDKPYTDITSRMEKYVIQGGAYGYFPNNAAAETIRSGGKIQQIISIAFPPYTNMRVLYPVLNRVPIILPFCYIYRLFEKTLGRNSERAKKKYKIIKEQDSDFIKDVALLMKMLKLDSK